MMSTQRLVRKTTKCSEGCFHLSSPFKVGDFCLGRFLQAGDSVPPGALQERRGRCGRGGPTSEILAPEAPQNQKKTRSDGSWLQGKWGLGAIVWGPVNHSGGFHSGGYGSTGPSRNQALPLASVPSSTLISGVILVALVAENSAGVSNCTSAFGKCCQARLCGLGVWFWCELVPQCTPDHFLETEGKISMLKGNFSSLQGTRITRF